MVLALDDHWVWDSWYVRDGDLWHAFFLQAPKSLADPEDRHWNVTYGHATSRDLIRWTYLGPCFQASEGPGWDDYTTWTGSVVKGDDGQWHLFYTGSSRADSGKTQRIGHAISADLHDWQRVGDGLVLDLAPPYEEYDGTRWHDRAFRDPWVMRDPGGDGWLMYFTARDARADDLLEAGAIGFATSPDLMTWTLREPVFTGAAGQLEVPQVFQANGRWFCLFCTDIRHWSEFALEVVVGAATGTHYLVGEGPRGPWRLAEGPMLDGAEPCLRYAGRIVDHDGLQLMAFRWFDGPARRFIGEIGDPLPVVATADGRLEIDHNAFGRMAHG